MARPPPSAAGEGGAGEVTQWVEYAVRQALDLKKTLGDAADTAFGAAESSLVHAVSASKSSLQEARVRPKILIIEVFVYSLIPVYSHLSFVDDLGHDGMG